MEAVTFSNFIDVIGGCSFCDVIDYNAWLGEQYGCCLY